MLWLACVTVRAGRSKADKGTRRNRQGRMRISANMQFTRWISGFVIRGLTDRDGRCRLELWGWVGGEG